MHTLLSRRTAVAVLLLGAAACSGGSEASPARPATVDESLVALGIDITQTPRVADQGTQELLPEDYAPFGAAQTFEKLDELMTVGFGLSGFGNDAITVSVVEEQQGGPGAFTSEALWRPTDTPWAVSSGATPTTLRAATSGDVDGDGLEELLVVSHSAGDAAVVVRTIQDRVAQFGRGTPVEVSTATPTSLAIVSGDFGGDGKKDAVVAVATAADVQLVFLTAGSGGLALAGRTLTLPALTPSATGFEVVLAAGNLDNDRGEELVVVMNERFQAGGSDSGVSRYWILDDANASFASRRQAQRVTANAAGADRSALTASAAIGDVDGDNVGEVLLGGITSFDAGGTCAYGYLLFALDGLDAGLAPLGATYHAGRSTGATNPPYPSLFPQNAVCTNLRLRTVHLLALDRDGDGADEIQANELSFEDFRQRLVPELPPAPWTRLTAVGDLTLHDLFGGTGDTFSGEFSRATSAFAAGDLTGESRADLVVYSQSAAAAGSPAVRVWAKTTDADWHPAISLATTAPPAEPLWPILVTGNVDTDSMSIQYAPASRKVVFTEPIVIAALAAPPCATNLGQDLDACRTSFGTASTTATDQESTWNVSAGLTIGATGGVNVFGAKFETEVTATIKGYYSRKTVNSYSLTKQVVNTTGALEDAVIFTSIPFDQFTYRILSHPDPTLVGTDVVISIPRAPIETMVERTFFNENVPEGSIQIDETVFRHVLGQPRTYPTAAERDALVAAKPELTHGPLDVCEGGGERSLEIVLGTALGTADTWGVEAELEVKATAGAVISGFSIGGGYESSLQVTHGTDTSYAGAVACLSAASYANPDNQYRFGLMSYIHDAPQQSFEVVNYWVE